ncbi:hypothetical protein [Streptomyces sp. NPDC085540]|uniref:hypothetical protein n=1 Tax=Streptomyces sp. NPDC085540 TaxID=3365730 RepID=UPI0037D5CA90
MEQDSAEEAEHKVSPRPDLDFKPVRNGLDYLLTAVQHLTEGESPPGDRDLKYAVLHLQAATEVLLKARLVHEHWSLVYKDPRRANLDDFRQGKFESCTLQDTMNRLAQVAGVVIPLKERKAIEDMTDVRNALMHYGHTANAYRVEAGTARVLGFLLTFITQELRPVLTSEVMEVGEAMYTLRTKFSSIKSLVKERMNSLSGELRHVAGRTVVCPDCRQWTLVVGETPVFCRFCLQTFEPVIMAEADYILEVIGESGRREHRVCPECVGFGHMVVGARTAKDPDTDVALCFQCGACAPSGA